MNCTSSWNTCNHEVNLNSDQWNLSYSVSKYGFAFIGEGRLGLIGEDRLGLAGKAKLALLAEFMYFDGEAIFYIGEANILIWRS